MRIFVPSVISCRFAHFRLVILYYTAGGARCKGERGENARNVSENADEEWHAAQKQMEIIGFLTKAGERLRGEGGPQGKPPPKGAALGGGAATATGGRQPCGPYSGGLQGPAEGEIPPGIAPKKLRRGKLCLNNSADMMILSA